MNQVKSLSLENFGILIQMTRPFNKGVQKCFFMNSPIHIPWVFCQRDQCKYNCSHFHGPNKQEAGPKSENDLFEMIKPNNPKIWTLTLLQMLSCLNFVHELIEIFESENTLTLVYTYKLIPRSYYARLSKRFMNM